MKFVALQIENIRAGDVRRHEVGRELDAREIRAEDACECADEQRLGHARHAFDERVAAGKDGNERLFDDVVLADDDLAGFVPRLGEDFLESFCVHKCVFCLPRVSEIFL